MNALYDEICFDDYDDFIKLTTVYPSFINTRQELADILDTIEEFTPRMTPEYVAQEVVSAMLKNIREINLPRGVQCLSITK
jgi:hypothetical protein